MGIDHVLPNNIDAERAVLGAMLMPDEGPEAIQKVLDMGLSANHFYWQKHQLIFDAIRSLHNKSIPADLLTATKELEQSKRLEKAGGVAYLNGMIDAVPTAANVAYYAKMVRDASARRNILRHLSKVTRKVDDESVEIEEIFEDMRQMDGFLPKLSQDQRRKKPVDAESFCQVEAKPIPMIVGKGLIPAFGYTMLAGYAKSGKTTLGLQLCLSIATGKPFVNKFPIRKPGAETLYCYLENTDDGIRKIITEQRSAWGAPIENLASLHLLDAKGLRLQNAGDLRYLRNAIHEKQIKLCIIDPISLALQGDQNDYNVVRTLINALHAMGQDTGAAFLLIHHFHKPGAVKRDAIHAMIGSSAWGNFAESVVGLERFSDQKPQDYKRMTFVLRSAQAPEDLCLYRNEHSLFELVGSPEQIPTEKVMVVVDVMKEHGQPASPTLLKKLIMEESEISERQAERLMAAAVKGEHIERKPGKRGNYFLPRISMSDVGFDGQSQS